MRSRQLKGVDVVWLGHYDLNEFMGIPGQFDNRNFKRLSIAWSKPARP
jgi:hypothetical protein